MEDKDKVLPCAACHNPASVSFTLDFKGSPETGRWITTECECGAVYYICERDFDIYRRYRSKKNEVNK